MASRYTHRRAKAKGRFIPKTLHPTDEIPFPDIDAGLTQDCVRAGAVEIEVRHGEMHQVLLARELHGIAGDLQLPDGLGMETYVAGIERSLLQSALNQSRRGAD